jgi:hypothetical protein
MDLKRNNLKTENQSASLFAGKISPAKCARVFSILFIMGNDINSF